MNLSAPAIIKKFSNQIKVTYQIALPLYRIMIPMMVLIKVLKEFGAIELLGHWLAPLMGIVGLPGSMGLVWAMTLVAGFYPGMYVFVDLAASEILTVGQVTIISSLMLIAHALPIELKITGKAGARWWSMGLFRIGAALLYGAILNQILHWGGWLSSANVLLWQPNTESISLQVWAWNQVVGLLLMFVIIFILVQFMKALDRFGITRFLHWLFRPLLKSMGIGQEATNITIIGITLGIAYGGGLLIKESQSGAIPHKDIFFALALMGIFHSVIEDTLLILLLGGSMWGFLVGRMVFSFILIWSLVRIVSLISDQTFKRLLFKQQTAS